MLEATDGTGGDRAVTNYVRGEDEKREQYLLKWSKNAA